MLVDNVKDLPKELSSFFSAAGKMFVNPLFLLGVPESLTDEVAVKLAVIAGLTEKQANGFVKALHFCDFVVERNSEWHFSPKIINYLNEKIDFKNELVQKAHKLLFDISLNGDIECAGKTIPRYLLSDVGRAFHKSPMNPEEGLALYSVAANKVTSGSQWLLGRLAIAQQERGVLPFDAIEPSYIRGMTLYKEGQYKEAESFFRRVISSNEVRIEVAIACHIVGRLTAHKSGGRKEAEELLRKSLKLLEQLNDRYGQAQVLHTLGQLLGKDRNRAKEAEELLRKSIKLDPTQHGQAQALHTLGQLLGKDRNRAKEAEELLRQSLEIAEKGGSPHDIAQRLHTLGQLLGKDRNRAKEAEELLRKSIEIGEAINHHHHQAQALHTLGQLLGKDRNRAKEAEELLRKSLKLLEQLNDRYGQAQVLHTLGQLLGKDRNRAKEAEELLRKSIKLDPTQHGQAQALHTLGQLLGKNRNRTEEAEELLRRSLKIGHKNKNHKAQVLFTLGKLMWKGNQDEAEALLQESIELNRKMKNFRHMKLVQKELEKLRSFG